MQILLHFLHDKRGDLAQFALILVLVVIVTVTVLADLGNDISSVIGNFDTIAFGGSAGEGSTGGGVIDIQPGPGPIPIPDPGSMY